MRILIVEDDGVSRRVLEAALQRLGHPCASAVDGEEGWAVYQELRPDVLVTDWMMPGMDGIELVRRVRASAGDDYAYVIMLTALAEREQVLEAMRAGVDDHLTKPLDLQELRARLIAAARVSALHRRIASSVTDLREATRQLRESQACFRGAFDQSPLGMAMTDQAGSFREVNESLAAMLGHDLHDLRRFGLDDVTHEDDRQPLPSEGRHERRLLHRSGDVVWAEVTVSHVLEDVGDGVHVLVQVQDVTARRAADIRLRELADHDGLSGLLNRRAFTRAMELHVERCRRYGAAGALLMLDIDGFKGVNDAHGHQAGDRLIVEVSQALRQRLRASDVIGRLGGDEFAVLLPEGDEREARHVADALCSAVRTIGRAAAANGGAPTVTASVGIAVFEGGEGARAAETLNRADLAMYEAKQAGRDGYRLYADR